MEEGKPVAGEHVQGNVDDDPVAGTSLTRRKALGMGAVALGGAALGGLAGASGADAAGAKIVPGDFKKAVTKLATDSTFRANAIKDPTLITSTFTKITQLELDALRHCAILSGANVQAIDQLRADAIHNSVNSGTPPHDAIVVGGHPTGWSISCTCCCCCCCGESAVVVR